MAKLAAQSSTFHISEDLDYAPMLEHNNRQDLAFSPAYPAVVQLHEEIPAQDVPLHWHHGPEFLFVRHGCVQMLIDGYSTHITDGQCCLISSDAFHAIHPVPRTNTQSVLSVTFDDRRLDAINPNICNTKIMQCTPLGKGTDYPDETMLELCENLIEAMDDTDSDLSLINVNRLLFTLLGHIYSNYSVKDESDDPGQADNVDDRIKPVVSYMEHHYSATSSIAEVSEKFGYSPEYFSRFFSEHAGIGPKQYLTGIRLRHCIDELLMTDDTIETIAANNGLSTKSLVRAVQKRFHVSPTQFRQQNRIKP
ncbi:AraC family transcriptional regulator [Bifidobacterium sp. ESL0764]|uniref:AraC family transcriptional regulator n=1 Tax=Bifidobacterium sp. ESL0764 TaxID=2983228 RepID=UPI0023F93836|nr:AraC family transcriptional regulator [Bifidobacterium sp. ESL0764]WEV65361.1 AraC family transcriptional regulator [Bifidobacterium sp. ESL0764]